jgi:hypothetical protein
MFYILMFALSAPEISKKLVPNNKKQEIIVLDDMYPPYCAGAASIYNPGTASR